MGSYSAKEPYSCGRSPVSRVSVAREEDKRLAAEASSTFFFRSSLPSSALRASSAAASARNSMASQAGSSALDEMAGSDSGSEEGVLRARGVTKAVQDERGCLSRPRTLYRVVSACQVEGIAQLRLTLAGSSRPRGCLAKSRASPSRTCVSGRCAFYVTMPQT